MNDGNMHPRVLIVGTIPYNPNTSSRAFDAYFHNWERSNLRQIFSNSKSPLKGHCGSLFQITDARMLKRRFHKRADTGIIYNYEDCVDEWKDRFDYEVGNSILTQLYKLGSNKCSLNYLLRKWLWKEKYWNTKKLNDWLEEFQPECVFLAFSDDFFIPQIALYVAAKFDIPIVSCIGDDYYFNNRFSLSPFYYVYRLKYKRLIRKVFAHGGSAVYIGNKIRDKYNYEFGLDGQTVYLTSELIRHDFKRIDSANPYISYSGNIRLGRSDSLCDIATALGRINPKYTINVYSNESEKKYYMKLKSHPNIVYGGAIPYSQVMKIMEKSDILLVVEGFSKKNVDITRYSLSTKVADALAVGCSVFAYGSIECGAIEYMQQINCGPVCVDSRQLESQLRNLLFDIEFQKENYERSLAVYNQNHNLKNSNYVFENVVKRAIMGYVRGKKVEVE